LIVSAGSVQELIAAIDLCCSNPRLLRDMGEAAYETARQYSWARFRNSFLTLTESCLKRPAIDA
jgi:glycosyltransferase involved in cell wall biosynthesis